MPKFELPQIDVPKVELPSAEQIADCARNAVFVSVGLAVTVTERVVDTVKAGLNKTRTVL